MMIKKTTAYEIRQVGDRFFVGHFDENGEWWDANSGWWDVDTEGFSTELEAVEFLATIKDYPPLNPS